jgi:glycosyltransferase involved in cell wall biosynthesis
MNLSLLVVGDGPEMTNLVSLAESLNSRTTFVGNASSSELIKYLQSSRAYILNSTADATAYSLLEARSCGLIAIANIQTGASEVILHKVDGYLTQSTDYREVENSLNWVFSKDKLQFKAMGDAARRSTLEKFNRDLNFSKIHDLVVRK